MSKIIGTSRFRGTQTRRYQWTKQQEFACPLCLKSFYVDEDYKKHYKTHKVMTGSVHRMWITGRIGRQFKNRGFRNILT